MSSLTDRSIQANRTTQDRLARLVSKLSEQDLSRSSGAAEWSVAQVLSHLGSGAEITLDTLRAAQAGEARPGDANGPISDRWNTMPPQEQAAECLRAGEKAVAAMEGLDAQEREQLQVPLPFLPAPADLSLFAGMRLNEAVMHTWDTEVAFDPNAAIPAEVAEVLLEQLRGPLAFLLGFAGKPDRLGGRTAELLVQTSAPQARLGLSLTEGVAFTEAPSEPDGELRLPADALLRLVMGRLDPRRLDPDPARDGVHATGSMTLDDLRTVFPGL